MQIITSNQQQVSRVVKIEAFLRQIFAKPSGQYLVTVNEGHITQVAMIDRPIHIENCIEAEPAPDQAVSNALSRVSVAASPSELAAEPEQGASDEEQDAKPARKRKSAQKAPKGDSEDYSDAKVRTADPTRKTV